MPAKDSLIYIMHIRDSCRRIVEYTVTGGNNWTSRPLIMDAVCRNITIIGEAARKLDDAFQRAHRRFLGRASSVLGTSSCTLTSTSGRN
jgi:uncharacterized protein with HEPN domain